MRTSNLDYPRTDSRTTTTTTTKFLFNFYALDIEQLLTIQEQTVRQRAEIHI